MQTSNPRFRPGRISFRLWLAQPAADSGFRKLCDHDAVVVSPRSWGYALCIACDRAERSGDNRERQGQRYRRQQVDPGTGLCFRRSAGEAAGSEHTEWKRLCKARCAWLRIRSLANAPTSAGSTVGNDDIARDAGPDARARTGLQRPLQRCQWGAQETERPQGLATKAAAGALALPCRLLRLQRTFERASLRPLWRFCSDESGAMKPCSRAVAHAIRDHCEFHD